MNKLKISIVTPSYNQGAFIEETILSIINQNYPNLEYIIIDGGSTDNSVDIIRKYEKHLAYWVSEKDNGQSEAINKGFKKATGDIICWLNSDDILIEGALNKVANIFTANKELDLINGQTVLIDKNSNILSGHFVLKQKKWYAERGIYYINQPSMFWRRSLLDSTGLLKEDFHTLMDKEFLIRMFERNVKIGHLEKFLAGFRIHGESKSAGNPTSLKWFEEDNQKLLELYRNSYGQNPKLITKLIYRFEKLIRGIYAKQFFFSTQWNGKNVRELNANNCAYL
ncbi:MAG: glycosyltransferase family 2 protein [Chryseolinea sp.]